MHEVKVINKQHKIIGISWIGKVTPEDIHEANGKLAELIKPYQSKGFDVLVDMNEITVLFPETQKELVLHQEWLIESGMQRAAVVVSSSIAKMQLKRTAKQSNHETELHFNNQSEALDFLVKTPVR
ncbi:STAS/SEC14 domain-containing protein [Salipaludibacillus daqingensis]|uniref:STAS/SEC14 domain-containing protein n=1 Tax=Salipaludibacillus daqingensis TaxID=3041001 RepID=UPI0024745427|nr:STAS/SEC14 domain-containing protein [Salipaludibacillus daqingensis]